jgi:AraC-like DNA-binding protein
MKLFIRNMVCMRCKTVVRVELEKLGISTAVVDLGEVEITGNLTSVQEAQLKIALLKNGLELMDDKKSKLIERIRSVIIQLVHHSDDGQLKTNFSVFLSERLGYDYTYLANIFSQVQGITIEKFLIAHKIERVKELLVYNELNLTEIAGKLHYSSVAHLSNQFKKVTGLTPSHFRQMKDHRRKNMENV